MKRIIAMCISIMMLLTTAIFANESALNEVYDYYEKNERAEALLSELNSLAAQSSEFQSQQAASRVAFKDTAKEGLLTDRKSEIDAELESLGIHTVTQEDVEAVARLNNIIAQAEQHKNSGASAAAAEAPTFADILPKYDVKEETAHFVVDGVSYESLRVIVTNKTGTTLVRSTVNPQSVPMASISDVEKVRQLYDYQVSFLTDLYFGAIPYSWVAEWSLGSWFAFNDRPSNTSISVNGDCYLMAMNSVTQMTYYYLYLPNWQSWVQCGCKVSNCTYSRQDIFMYSEGGQALQRNWPAAGPDQGVLELSNPKTWTWYVEEYLDTGIDYGHGLGTLEFAGGIDNAGGNINVFEFTPAFCGLITNLR